MPPILQSLENFDAVTLFQSDVGLLPIRPPPDRAAPAAFFAEKIRCANLDHCHLKQILDHTPYLILAGARPNSEHHLVALFANDRAFLGDQWRNHQPLGAHSDTPVESLALV